MIVTIHQPEHLPWLGFFDKLRQADVWVSLDSVQFRKNYFQNRNQIRGRSGALWVTVPVLTKGKSRQVLGETRINNDGEPRWREKCWSTVSQTYGKAKYWASCESFFRELYSRSWELVSELNEHIIDNFLNYFSIKVRKVRSSELKSKGEGSELLLNICQELKADVYLSGVSGRDYLDMDAFSRSGIEVRFQEFHHPIYRQMYDPFLPCMSATDLLVNEGPASLEVLKGVGVQTMEKIFL